MEGVVSDRAWRRKCGAYSAPNGWAGEFYGCFSPEGCNDEGTHPGIRCVRPPWTLALNTATSEIALTDFQLATCPRCDSSTLTKTSQWRGDLGGFFAVAYGGPKQFISVYRCACGVSFTQCAEQPRLTQPRLRLLERNGL